MRVRIWPKWRILLAFLLSSFFLGFAFQNCAAVKCPVGNGTGGGTGSGTVDCTTNLSSTSGGSSTGSSTSSSGSSSSGGSGSSSGGSSSGSNSYGSIGSGGGSIYGGGGFGSGGLGGGSSTEGSSGGSTGGGLGGGSSDTTFRITKQPESINVFENASFTLEVALAGGKAPYSYQWYKNNKPVSDVYGIYSQLAAEANTYTVEGDYYVIVKDATGASLQSLIARVRVAEVIGDCPAGSYFTFTDSRYDQAYNYFTEYFDGPKGKFILHSSYDKHNIVYSAGRFAGLAAFNVPSLTYMEKTDVACNVPIPRINSPPGTYNWSSTGVVTFECHNKRLKLISNTCQWTQISE